MRTLVIARAALVVVVVLDLVALAAFSIRLSSTTTQTVRPIAAPASAAATTASSTPQGSAPAFPVGAPALSPITTVPVAAAANVAAASSGAPPSAPASGPTGSTGQPSEQQACPIALKTPAQNGGLQSLISFAPAFGPFKAEAFAMAAAYQPALQLLGPILATYPALAPKVEPVLAPLLTQWEHLLDSLYGLLSPYYSPFRTTVLQDEANLAAVLAPYAQQLANSALGGCVVDLEAALVQDTR